MHKLMSIAFFSLAALAVSSALADGDLDTLLQDVTFDAPEIVGDSQPMTAPATQLISEQPAESESQSVLDAPMEDAQDGFTKLEETQRANDATMQPLLDPPAPKLQPTQQFVNAPPANSPYVQHHPMPGGQAYGHRNDARQMRAPQAAGCGCATCRAAQPRHGCDGPASGCQPCGQQEEQYVYIPHRVPNLPSSTLLQYFRSDSCYTGLWDGYAQERAKRCAKYHKHIHGMCDCAAKSAAHQDLDCSLLRASPGGPGCARCDTGCDSCRY